MTEQTVISQLRQHAVNIFNAGVAAADPFVAVKRCLAVANGQLTIALDLQQPELKRTGHWQQIHVIAIGKAACAMAEAAQQIIPTDLLAGPAIAITNYENVRAISGVEVIGAGHPLPDAAGLAAAHIVAAKARVAQAGDLVLVLVSGGGSALIPYPVDDITLSDKVNTTDLLLACGATINEINCVRKHLSQLKGGNLARLAAPADVHALILSDVLGDDLSTIASGPTVADDSTYNNAITILQNKQLWEKIPSSVRAHLTQGQLGQIAETPKSNDPALANSGYTLVGSNNVSVHSCINAAEKHGYQAILYNHQLCGEAKTAAEELVLHAVQLQSKRMLNPIALLSGGETTVTLTGPGKGGRNQEMALAFAIFAQKHGLTEHWTFLSGGTDGRDGPTTDAAGGLVDPNSLQRMLDKGINPNASLINNDAYNALMASQDLLITGATGTNVADLQILLLNPSQ
jgi:hydroxypyruvate reductase